MFLSDSAIRLAWSPIAHLRILRGTALEGGAPLLPRAGAALEYSPGMEDRPWPKRRRSRQSRTAGRMQVPDLRVKAPPDRQYLKIQAQWLSGDLFFPQNLWPLQRALALSIFCPIESAKPEA